MLTTLRDTFTSDLDGILDNDEHARPVNIDGVDIPKVVVDEDLLQPENQPDRDGVYLSLLTLHLAASKLPKRPVQGQRMRVDGKGYIVDVCGVAEGLLTIKLIERAV